MLIVMAFPLLRQVRSGSKRTLALAQTDGPQFKMIKAASKALSRGGASSTDPELKGRGVDLLLRFFQSSFFNEWIAIQWVLMR